MEGLPLAIECLGGQGACGCSNLTGNGPLRWHVS